MKVICSLERLSQGEFDAKFGVALEKMCTRDHHCIETLLLDGLSIGFISTIQNESLSSICFETDSRLLLLLGYPNSLGGGVDALIHKHLAGGIEQLIEAIYQGVEGAFCILIKEANGEFYVITDPLGLFPLYQNSPSDDLSLTLSTEIKGLSVTNKEVQLCPKAFVEWVSIGATSGASCLVKTISRLESAKVYKFRVGNSKFVQKYTYWTYHKSSRTKLSSSVLDLAYESLKYEILSIAEHYENHTISLSGGFDSRLIAAILVSENIEVKSIAVSHPDEHGDLDGYLARLVASELKIKHTQTSPPKDFFSYINYFKYQNESELSNPGLSMFIAAVTQSMANYSQSMWNGLCVGAAFKLSGCSQNSLESYYKYMVKGDFASYLSRFSKFFNCEYSEAIEYEGSKLISDLSGKYGGDINGLATYIEDGRIRHRVAMNPIKVMANYTHPFTPGLSKPFLAAISDIPTPLRFSEKLHQEILARHFPRLYNIPVVSGGEVYIGGSVSPLVTAQLKYRRYILGHWRIKKLFKNNVNQATFEPTMSQTSCDILDQAEYSFGLREGFFHESFNSKEAEYKRLSSYALSFCSVFNAPQDVTG